MNHGYVTLSILLFCPFIISPSYSRKCYNDMITFVTFMSCLARTGLNQELQRLYWLGGLIVQRGLFSVTKYIPPGERWFSCNPIGWQWWASSFQSWAAEETKSPFESLVSDHVFGVLTEIQLFFGTCVVYTKTIIYLGVVKSAGSLPHLCSKRSNKDIRG